LDVVTPVVAICTFTDTAVLLTGSCSTIVERRGACRVWYVNLKEIDHLENLGIERRIISKWIFKKWDVVAWTGLIWLRLETGVKGVMIFRVP
jgi:hypothetical protein